jgi:hypothetical protein
LKDWIYPIHLSKYYEIEKDLFYRKYIDNKGRWIKKFSYKKDFAEFTFLILKRGYFNNIVNGEKLKETRYRHFISDRYLGDKLALSETWKKYHKSFSEYTNTFKWIKSPD